MDSIGDRIGFGGEGGLPSQVGPVEEKGVWGGPLVMLLSDLD